MSPAPGGLRGNAALPDLPGSRDRDLLSPEDHGEMFRPCSAITQHAAAPSGRTLLILVIALPARNPVISSCFG